MNKRNLNRESGILQSRPEEQSAGGGNGHDTLGDPVEIKDVIQEIEGKLLDAARRRFTGEIRLTFNVSQGGFSTSYIEKERESLIRRRS